MNFGDFSLHRLLLVVTIAMVAFGCGRKGSPVPRNATVPAAINDLKAEKVGERVRVSWAIPKDGKDFQEGIKGFRLYTYSTFDPGSFCPTCPIPFEESVFVTLRAPAPARVEGGRVIYEEKFEPGYGYAYKTVVYHKSGGISADSNVVLVLPSQE